VYLLHKFYLLKEISMVVINNKVAGFAVFSHLTDRTVICSSFAGLDYYSILLRYTVVALRRTKILHYVCQIGFKLAHLIMLEVFCLEKTMCLRACYLFVLRVKVAFCIQ